MTVASTTEQALRDRAARAEAMGDATMRAWYTREADRYAAAERARAGLPGHAWLTGPWDRTCVRCGLCVRSLAAGRGSLRSVERGHASWYVLDGTDAPLSPCSDGSVGEYATVRAVAPWRHG